MDDNNKDTEETIEQDALIQDDENMTEDAAIEALNEKIHEIILLTETFNNNIDNI
jgi:hypothetical protein